MSPRDFMGNPTLVLAIVLAIVPVLISHDISRE